METSSLRSRDWLPPRACLIVIGLKPSASTPFTPPAPSSYINTHWLFQSHALPASFLLVSLMLPHQSQIRQLIELCRGNRSSSAEDWERSVLSSVHPEVVRLPRRSERYETGTPAAVTEKDAVFKAVSIPFCLCLSSAVLKLL